MKLRCDLHVNGGSRKLVLVPGPNETGEHLGLKLGAFLMFWNEDPAVGVSASHPALLGQEFIPDLMATDDTGAVKLWVECGKVTMHKLHKLTRRFPSARLVVMKATEREGRRLRQDMEANLDKGEKIEVFAWPGQIFQEWLGVIREKTEVYGEAGARTINLVINEHPFAADLLAF